MLSAKLIVLSVIGGLSGSAIRPVYLLLRHRFGPPQGWADIDQEELMRQAEAVEAVETQAVEAERLPD